MLDAAPLAVDGTVLAAGAVEGLYIAEEAGGPMTELLEATLVAKRGIVGDRYCKRKGTYSVFRASKLNPGQREPGRQLTLMAAEGVEAAFAMNGMKALDSLGDFRRNVVTRGIPAAALQAAVGRQIRLGDEVVVFVHRSTVPCHYNERKMERPGFVEVCWDVSGVSCEVLVGGQLRQGDAVRICGGEPQHDKVDEGQQTPGYFVRPSQRTKAQVRQAAAQRTALLPRLLEVDPAGVVRAVENYQTVGLKMFSRPKRFRRAQALQDRFLTMIGIFLFLIAFMVGQQKFHDHVQVYGGFDAWWDIVMPSLLGGRGGAAPPLPPPVARKPWWRLGR